MKETPIKIQKKISDIEELHTEIDGKLQNLLNEIKKCRKTCKNTTNLLEEINGIVIE